MNSLGETIRSERQEKDLTLRELAEKAETSFSHLGKIERGERNPTLGLLESIADALDMSPADLMNQGEKAG